MRVFCWLAAHLTEIKAWAIVSNTIAISMQSQRNLICLSSRKQFQSHYTIPFFFSKPSYAKALLHFQSHTSALSINPNKFHIFQLSSFYLSHIALHYSIVYYLNFCNKTDFQTPNNSFKHNNSWISSCETIRT